jgi:hypothetical protein
MSLYTVRELLQQIREQISEANDTRVTNSQILSALNRGYDDSFDIMGRLYPDPIIKFIETFPDAEGKIAIPDNVFEDRIMLVEYYLQNQAEGYRTKINETDNLNDLGIINNVSGSHPYVYSIIGRDIQLAPAKGMTKYRMRIWYVDSPLPLKLDQGRIQVIDTDNNFIVVDDLTNTDDGLTPIDPSSAYGKYINLVDSETGLYKATMQVESISGNKITFKTTPTRSTVFNLPVLGAIPEDVVLDDVISEVKGSGVVYFKKPITNYIIQYAVTEIQRSLGVANLSYEEGVLRDLKKRVEEVWQRRPASKFKRSYGRVWRSRRYRNWSF